MKTKILKVKITFLEPVLGTWPSNQNVARDFIASKSPDAATIEDEVAALGADAVADKGMTVFPRNENGEPVLYDYQIKGFFKDSCGMLARVGGKTETGKKRAVNESGKLSAYKKIIDGLIFPQPRMIPIKVNGKIGDCQRPLRAQTAQGERVSLANASLRSFSWTNRSRTRFWSGWTTAFCAASASGETAARAASPLTSSTEQRHCMDRI